MADVYLTHPNGNTYRISFDPTGNLGELPTLDDAYAAIEGYHAADGVRSDGTPLPGGANSGAANASTGSPYGYAPLAGGSAPQTPAPSVANAAPYGYAPVRAAIPSPAPAGTGGGATGIQSSFAPTATRQATSVPTGSARSNSAVAASPAPTAAGSGGRDYAAPPSAAIASSESDPTGYAQMVSSFSQRLDSPSAFSSYRDDVRQGKVSDSGGLIGNLPAPIDAVVPGTQYLSLDPHDSRSGYRVVRALDANGLPTARIEAFGPSGWDWFYAEHPNWTGDVTGQPYKVQGPFPGANPVSPLSNMAPTPRPGIAAALPAPDHSRFSSAGQLDPVIRTTVTAEPTVTLPQRLSTPRPPAAIAPPSRLSNATLPGVDISLVNQPIFSRQDIDAFRTRWLAPGANNTVSAMGHNMVFADPSTWPTMISEFQPITQAALMQYAGERRAESIAQGQAISNAAIAQDNAVSSAAMSAAKAGTATIPTMYPAAADWKAAYDYLMRLDTVPYSHQPVLNSVPGPFIAPGTADAAGERTDFGSRLKSNLLNAATIPNVGAAAVLGGGGGLAELPASTAARLGLAGNLLQTAPSVVQDAQDGHYGAAGADITTGVVLPELGARAIGAGSRGIATARARSSTSPIVSTDVPASVSAEIYAAAKAGIPARQERARAGLPVGAVKTSAGKPVFFDRADPSRVAERSSGTGFEDGQLRTGSGHGSAFFRGISRPIRVDTGNAGVKLEVYPGGARDVPFDPSAGRPGSGRPGGANSGGESAPGGGAVPPQHDGVIRAMMTEWQTPSPQSEFKLKMFIAKEAVQYFLYKGGQGGRSFQGPGALTWRKIDVVSVHGSGNGEASVIMKGAFLDQRAWKEFKGKLKLSPIELPELGETYATKGTVPFEPNDIVLLKGHNLVTLAEELFHFRQTRINGVLKAGWPDTMKHETPGGNDGWIEKDAYLWLRNDIGLNPRVELNTDSFGKPPAVFISGRVSPKPAASHLESQ